MKRGIRPTRDQKKLLQNWNLNPADWLVSKNTVDELVLIHRYSDKTTKVIPKERRK